MLGNSTPHTYINTPWRQSITRNFYNLVTICQGNEDATKICDNALEEMYKSVRKVFQTNEEKIRELDEEEERRNAIKDPKRPKTKGRPKRNKRIRGHFERRRTATRDPNEFGTKTPNPQLI